MAINFPSNPNNGDTISVGNKTYTFDSASGVWDIDSPAPGASITVYADMTALIAATGMSNGDQAFVTGNNNLYIYSSSGWYKVATVQNDSPSAITGVAGSYALAIDGTATTITAVSTDPEGFPLTWSYATSGLGNIATISQSDNVFTITPSTTEANAGTFTLTINATDGVNGAVSTTTNLNLEFIVIIENSKYTTLLATATGTSDNNDITDSSTNNHTIAVSGDTHAGTFSPYRHGGYSYEFDGSTDSIRADDHTDFNWSSSGFTIEGWVNLKAMPSGGVMTAGHKILFAKWNAYSNNREFLLSFGSNGTLGLVLSTDGTNWTTTASSNNVISLNTWHHICYEFNGSSHIIYVDGTAEVTVNNSSVPYAGNMPFGIGYSIDGANVAQHNPPQGFVTDVRVVNGSTVYGAAFSSSLPSERFAAVNNTKLLTCHLPYISDGSSSAHLTTINGSPDSKPFTPYDNLEYAEADNGGSVHYDGDGDYLTLPTAPTLGTSDFEISMWLYPETISGDDVIIDFRPSNTNGTYVNLLLTNGVPKLHVNGDQITGSSALPVSAWSYLTLTRVSGSTKLYVNGTQTGSTYSDSNNYLTGSSRPVIGQAGYNPSLSLGFNGYMSDLVVKLSGNSAPSVPTTPVSSSGSTLHVKGTDASIIDKSQSSNLKLVGNTTGSTTQVKFTDTKSMYFDGTSDYVFVPASPLLDVSSSDITIEGYFYTTSTTVKQGVWEFYADDNNYVRLFYEGDSGNVFRLTLSDGGTIRLNVTGTTNFSADTWHHIAVTRNHSTGAWKTFIDGVQDTGASGTESAAVDTSSWNFEIGRDLVSVDRYWSGYIQDFRVTKGLARYTANFTPPAEPLKG